MIIDLQIIKSLLNKEAYNKYGRWVKYDDLYKKHYALLRTVHDTNDGDISINDYLILAQQQGLQYLEEFRDIEIGNETLSELIRIHSERTCVYQLGLVCMEAFEGRRNVSDVFEAYSRLDSIQDTQENNRCVITAGLPELLRVTSKEEGIKWRLEHLQAALGSLNKGDFGFIFSRPEVGKTTFLASEVSHFLEQVDSPIIWFNNEERGEKVKTRVYQASLGLTYEELTKFPGEYEQTFLKNTNSNFILYDNGIIDKKEIERFIKETNPSLVVFDQIDKLKGFKGEKEIQIYGAIYQWAREIAKEYCPVIAVCQASVSAENKKYLGMDDVANSKTEKAAEADFILGIGKTQDIGQDGIRYLNLIKNKLTGNHSKIQCRINPSIARYVPL